MRTHVCASLVERSVTGVSRSSKLAFSQGADIVEVRFDFFPRIDRTVVKSAREAVKGPAIATLRSVEEGGRADFVPRERKRILEFLIAEGFDYVDLELRRDRELLDRLRGVREDPVAIASTHLTKPATGGILKAALAKACEAGVMGKLAMPCEHAGQALELAKAGRALSNAGAHLCAIGMGEQGLLTRACAQGIGSRLTYACIRGRPAAPGQVEIGLQRKLLGRDAVILGLIGHPVSHSVSKPMQEAALTKAGLAGIYIPMDVPPRRLRREDLELLRNIGFRGVNVTIPHKRAAYSACDVLRKNAADTGAVNTIIFRKGSIVGENTDVNGFSALLDTKKVYIEPGSTALVLGAGGAARAAARVLSDRGARVALTARRPSRARALAQEFGVASSTMKQAEGTRYDIVVNCTPAGMKGSKSRNALPPTILSRGSAYLDLVYNPLITPAMRAALRKGARTFGGLDMLVAQGAESFRLWTRGTPDTRTMYSAARRALR